jgi:predicted CXXCH cytochrome family protein
MMRFAATVGVLVLATGVCLPARAAQGNPHNLGSCTACHRDTPRFGIDTARSVTFTTSSDDPGLCRPCHAAETMIHPLLVPAGAGPAGSHRSSILPAGATGELAGKVVCTTCHYIHAAEGGIALLRGFPGSTDPAGYQSLQDFCADCHAGNLVGRAAHAPGDRSCVFCHAVKPAKARGAERSARAGSACGLCHPKVTARHYDKADPLGGRRECSACHDPHTAPAASPALLSGTYREAAAKSVTVKPHYRKALCFACHANTDDYALLEESVNATCDRCHASGQIAANIHPIRKVPPTIQPPKGWPLTDGALTCLTCHEQGHEDQKPRAFMLRGGPYGSIREVCPNCHGAVSLARSTIHQDINDGKDCEFCHKSRPVPGKDTAATATFIADPDLLCARCHDTTMEDPTAHHRMLMSRELKVESLPPGFPVVKGRVICGTCHNPHQRESQGYRLRDFLAETDICTACHAN